MWSIRDKTRVREEKSRRWHWSPYLLGTLFVVAGIAINPWAMGRASSVTDSGADYWLLGIVIGLEVIVAVTGIWILRRKRFVRVSILSALVTIPLAIATVTAGYANVRLLFPDADERAIRKIGRSEKVYLALSSGSGSVLK